MALGEEVPEVYHFKKYCIATAEQPTRLIEVPPYRENAFDSTLVRVGRCSASTPGPPQPFFSTLFSYYQKILAS